MPESTINYHVQKMLRGGLIIEVKKRDGTRTSPILYSLTNGGKTYLKLIDSTFSLGVTDLSNKPRPHYLLHHDQYKYPIIEDAPIHMNTEIQMKNWIKQLDEYKYCTAEKTPSNIIFHIKEIYGDNPSELELRSRKIANQMASYFEGSFGMQLGRVIRIGKPHIVDLYEDEIWQEFKKYVHIETPYAIIDKSPPIGKEFTSVDSAINYANMGNNITNLINGFNNFAKNNSKEHQDQLTVLTQIRDLLDSFVKTQQYKPSNNKEEYIQ